MRRIFLALLAVLLAIGLASASIVSDNVKIDNVAVAAADMAGPPPINLGAVKNVDDERIILGGADDGIVFDSRTSWVNTGPADLSDAYYMTTHVGMVLDLNTAAVPYDEDGHALTSSLEGAFILERTARDWVS